MVMSQWFERCLSTRSVWAGDRSEAKRGNEHDTSEDVEVRKPVGDSEKRDLTVSRYLHTISFEITKDIAFNLCQLTRLIAESQHVAAAGAIVLCRDVARFTHPPLLIPPPFPLFAVLMAGTEFRHEKRVLVGVASVILNTSENVDFQSTLLKPNAFR
ncbi:hypothetical protein EVAR_2237_1 [Eumeta japonica]|uniref:Uncharacterized protein n=1 Tax=Eumeta variegata TaxID=151549 RepID=A0A4C1SFH3_EUMVA|nr:hypothetical protein EVAR_2237_1 [Eumeta japonica]